jgi:hypothetical protein
VVALPSLEQFQSGRQFARLVHNRQCFRVPDQLAPVPFAPPLWLATHSERATPRAASR